jgi:hypothetical protein
VVGAGVGGERGAPATTAPAALGGAMLTEAKASCHVFLRGMLVELTRAVVLTPVVVLVLVVAFRYCHSWTRYAFPIWRRKKEKLTTLPLHDWKEAVDAFIGERRSRVVSSKQEPNLTRLRKVVAIQQVRIINSRTQTKSIYLGHLFIGIASASEAAEKWKEEDV